MKRTLTPLDVIAGAMKAAGVPQRKIGDAIKNWFKVVYPRDADIDELVGFVRWYGKRLDRPWNPAQSWNVRQTEGGMRFRWALNQYRKSRVSSARKVDAATREWARGFLEG